MFAPASFDDAASRYLEESGLSEWFRWDPDARLWAKLEDGVWTHVTTEVAVTRVARHLADEFAFAEAIGDPVPWVLSGIPKATTWAALRKKVSYPAANRAARLASGSPAFCGLPGHLARPLTRPPAPEDDSVADWVRRAVVASPGSFLRRSALTAAFKAAHGEGAPSRQVVSRVAQEVLGVTAKRSVVGWPDMALA